MQKVLVTGGCGFIGSNFIRYLLTDKKIPKDIEVINLDKLSYAGSGRNIEYLGLSQNPRYQFIEGDICDPLLVQRIFEIQKPLFVFNFAAESHVDKSIKNDLPFIKTNILGTHNLLENSLKYGLEKFVQISTDEVYGSINKGSFSENSRLSPSNPYAATKASADMLSLAYFKTHQFPLIITRSANNYGPFQFPEKIIPLFITNLIAGKKVPLMWSEKNPGNNIRDWLHVTDNCRGIWHISQYGQLGEIYNIPGENKRTNIEMTRILLNAMGLGEEMIQKIPHRKGHDFRYSIDGEKLRNLGFTYKHQDFEKEINEVIKWYKENGKWWRPLKK